MSNFEEMSIEQLRDNLLLAEKAKQEATMVAKDLQAEAIRRAQAKNDANPMGTNRLGDVLSVSAWEANDLDQEAAAALYAAAEADGTLNLLPIKKDVKTTYKLEATKFKAAKDMNPAVYAAVDAVVLVKPKSATVKALGVAA